MRALPLLLGLPVFLLCLVHSAQPGTVPAVPAPERARQTAVQGQPHESEDDHNAGVKHDLPEDLDIDFDSVFAAMVDDGDIDEDDNNDENTPDPETDEDYNDEITAERRARSSTNGEPVTDKSEDSSSIQQSATSQERAADQATIGKYNTFIDVLFRRLNAELQKQGEPLQLTLKKGSARKNKGNNKNKKGKKSKKGKKGKKGKPKSQQRPQEDQEGRQARRHPRDLALGSHSSEGGHHHKSHTPAVHGANSNDTKVVIASQGEQDEEVDDAAELDDDKNTSTKESAGDIRESKAKKSQNRDNDDSDSGTGLGMLSKRVQNKRSEREKKKGGKRDGSNKNKKKESKKNGNKKKKGKKPKKNKKGKKKNKNATTVAPAISRSNDGTRAQQKKSQGRKNSGGQKKNDTAAVSGISTLSRTGDVTVKHTSNAQQITSDFILGPVTVEMSRKVGSEIRTARSVASSLKGKITVEVSKNARAKISHLKISKPSEIKVFGSLGGAGATKPGQEDKAMKTLIKRVSPKINKVIKNAAKTVLDSTSDALLHQDSSISKRS